MKTQNTERYTDVVERRGLGRQAWLKARTVERLYRHATGEELGASTREGVDSLLRWLRGQARAGDQRRARSLAQYWQVIRRAVETLGRQAAKERMDETTIVKALRVEAQEQDWTARALDDGELAALRRAINAMARPGWLRPLMLLYLATGARLSELVGLRVGDVQDGGKLLNVLRKGGKRRLIPVLDETARAALQGLLESGEKSATDFVFVGEGIRHNEHVGVRIVQTRARQLLRMAEVDETGRCVHVLRHTFATRLAERGLGIEKLAMLMDHENVQTTRRYVHLQRRDVAREAEALLANAG